MKLAKLVTLYNMWLERIRVHDRNKALCKAIDEKMQQMDYKELDIMYHCAMRIEDRRCLFMADPFLTNND